MTAAFEFLDKFSIVLSIVLAIPVIWTWCELMGRRKRRKQWMQDMQRTGGQRPSILVIDYLRGEKEMRASLESYRNKEQVLREIKEDMVFTLESKREHLNPSDIPDFVDDLREKVAELSRTGTDTIHLFYGGPATLATFVGRELGNGCQVILYQYTQSSYVSWGPLSYDVIDA